jgi:hypothetical protein
VRPRRRIEVDVRELVLDGLDAHDRAAVLDAVRRGLPAALAEARAAPTPATVARDVAKAVASRSRR